MRQRYTERHLDPELHTEHAYVTGHDSYIACPRAVVAVMERRRGVERHRLPCMSRSCSACKPHVDRRDARRVLYAFEESPGLFVARRLASDWTAIRRRMIRRGADVVKAATSDPDVIWVLATVDLGGYGAIRETERDEVIGDIMADRPLQPSVLLTGTSLPTLDEWEQMTRQTEREPAGEMFFASEALTTRAFVALARQYGLDGHVDMARGVARIAVDWHDKRFRALRKRILRDYAATRDVDDWTDDPVDSARVVT